MIHVSKSRFVLGWISAAVIAGASGACSSQSDSETATGAQGGTNSGSGGSSAAGGTSGGVGGSSMSGSSSGGSSSGRGGSGGGQMAGTGGSSKAGAGGSVAAGTGGEEMAGKGGSATAGTGGGSDACAPRTKFTLGVHVVMNVTWPDTLATSQGTGKVHIWNRSIFDVNGTELSGDTSPCGSVLPPLTLSALAGGGMALIEIPDATWDLPNMPDVSGGATLEGWTVGSRFSNPAATALVGVMMDDAGGAWPANGTMVMTVDHDDDTKPGITGIPKSDGGFVLPPTSILGQVGAVADQVYLVTRTSIAMDGAMTSCTEQAGTVDVPFFDNHVVGCHIKDGDECDETQASFIDTNRTIFEVVDATYTAKILADDASCADVRAALPE
jgi:hypothetical protein